MDVQTLVQDIESKQGAPVPLLRPSQFAILTGLPEKTVYRYMDTGELPVVTLKPRTAGNRPRRFVNLVALQQYCEKEAKSWSN